MELFIATVHRIGARAERRVTDELVNAFKRVSGKENILFSIAEAALEKPDDAVRAVVFPAVTGGEQTLRELVGSEIVMCTAKNAPKLPALRKNPAVALTIDTEVHPPKSLLIRGRAELDVVDGIPDEYLEASGTYEMTPEQRVDWEVGVRSLYDGMVRIVVTSTWGKLIDFEATLPSAVEELVRQREERQHTAERRARSLALGGSPTPTFCARR